MTSKYAETAHEISALTRRLVDVAMGRKPADLVIQNGQWVCVQSGEIISHTDIAISDKHIAYVGPDASHTIGGQTRVIQANGQYLAPGLLDGHMHVESGMLTITEFVRAVIPHGTTGMFVDPHEIANVLGLRGVQLMVDEAAQQPVHVWVQMPSCVPSAPGFETPGASLGPEEVAEAIQWPGVIGLGEMMNFPGVYMSDEKMHAEMAATRAAGKLIGGHYASPDLGLPFHGYVAGGVQDDHEGTRVEDAVARVRQGMKAMLRFGSAWHDVAEGVRAITEQRLDSRHFILCTDDSHSETLVSEGHVNRAVKQAIAHGVSPMTALQMATLNTAEHFGVAHKLGMIAPGRYADILIINDLSQLTIELVIAQGQIAAKQGKLLLDLPAYPHPDWATHTVHFPRDLQAGDFRLLDPFSQSISDGSEGSPHQRSAIANVIGVIENQAPTRHLRLPVQATDGEVQISIENDLAKVALVERHTGSGKINVGLVHGFGFNTECAIASTVVHDSHQMIVVGTSETDMAMAANLLGKIGGGQIVIHDGKVLGQVDLPIAGLMSNKNAQEVARQAASVLEGFKACGCMLNNPNMQLSLLALVVIPELRLSDLGLVDVTQFKFIPVVES
jgi:adenine deaminase